MTRELTVYVDVVCPFAYLASTQLEALTTSTGATLALRPILLGGLFRQIGQVDDPNRAMPEAKVLHMRRDLARWAQRFDVPLRMPAAHPRRTVLAMRAITSLEGRARERAMHALFAAYWVHGHDVADPEIVARALDDAGLDGARAIEDAATEGVKTALFETTAEAARRGVFGVPTFIVRDEMFWGQDRLDWVRERLPIADRAVHAR